MKLIFGPNVINVKSGEKQRRKLDKNRNLHAKMFPKIVSTKKRLGKSTLLWNELGTDKKFQPFEWEMIDKSILIYNFQYSTLLIKRNNFK